ncbi:LysE/ArgO family amino acid transporter [Niveibacterium terrae]|uniref:LysE/ArgO family amino acid transporter n=1 Tax=Niveibacterium terrae TaxID=3373598 RepID=UPI003A9124B7
MKKSLYRYLAAQTVLLGNKTDMNIHILFQGFLVTIGLIMAIGAQNAHVLRMGLTRQHVLPTIAICIASDALMMGLGVAGMGEVIALFPTAVEVASWAGAAFLAWYGLRSLRAAFTSHALTAAEERKISLRQAVLMVLAFTYLNPHAWLDTVVLVGSIGGRQHGLDRFTFWLGCVGASTSWFVLLGFGARWLAPLFGKPSSWRVLDALVGLGMGAIAISLIR